MCHRVISTSLILLGKSWNVVNFWHLICPLPSNNPGKYAEKMSRGVLPRIKQSYFCTALVLKSPEPKWPSLLREYTSSVLLEWERYIFLAAKLRGPTSGAFSHTVFSLSPHSPAFKSRCCLQSLSLVVSFGIN